MKALLLGLILFLASDVHAGEHIFINYAPDAAYTITCEVGPTTADHAGILRYDPGTCGRVTITRGATDIHYSGGCDAEPVPEELGCTYPATLNRAIGFYHAVDDSTVGYVEFVDGVYWTARAISFGQHMDEVTRRQVCITDWSTQRAAARITLKVPVGICVYTLRGAQRCGTE